MKAEVLVIDCSVAAKWVLREPDRDAAIEVFNRWESGEVALIAPDLLISEFVSLLARRCRRKQLTAEQAGEAYRLITRCTPRLFDTRPLVLPALRLSLLHNMSLWDCVYIALALERDCAFITADRRLFRGGAGRHPCLRFVQ